MFSIWQSAVVTVTVSALLICPAPGAETRLATFRCQERLGRDWPRTMVRYAAKFARGRVKPDRVRLLDQEGEEVPVQLSRVERHADGSIASALVCFMAELPAGGSYRYQLVDGRATAGVPNPPQADVQGTRVTLDNGIVAIRLPKSGTVVFDQPLHFGTGHEQMVKLYGRQETAGIAPGPVQGFRIQGNRWVGGSYFEAANPDEAPQVLGYTCEITERGPLFVEARIKYTFDKDRYYQLSARVLAGDPAVRIDEQYDMRELGHTRDRHGYLPEDWNVVVSLSSAWRAGGWKPDHAYWGRYAYGSSLVPENTPLEKRLAGLGFDFSSKAFGTHRVSYGEPATRLFGVEPWNPYGDFAAYFGLLDSRTVTQKENTPFLAIVPVHAGTWRADGPYGYKSLYAHRSDVALHWPLCALLHPNRVFHTGEYDPELPYTFGRRQWALVGGPVLTVNELDAFRKYEGYINLDDYKDWVLEWRQDPKVTYPRMFFGKDDVARWARSLDRHPAGKLLKQYLYFQEDAERREQAYQRVTSPRSQWGSPLGQTLSGLSHWFPLWRQAHMTGQWAPTVDELLAGPELTAEQRRNLRCYVAAVCHLVSEPDFNPRGSMAHLGTVNMAIIRFLALTEAAVLIPDHPHADRWLGVSEQFVRFKLAGNTAPGGGWAELFTYYDASAPALIHAAHLLRRTGRVSDEDVTVAEQLAKFPLRYLPPKDPRFGVSVIPCWGHESTKNFGQWLPAAALLHELRPESAKALLWGWDRGGRLAGYHDAELNRRCVAYADLLNTLPKDYVPVELCSTWTPGIGAVLRAHPGDPNGTYLSYRQGYLLSHCDDNQGDFVLYAKGAPLVGMSLFGYPLHQHDPYVDMHLNFGWFSHPRFGSRDNTANMREGSNDSDKVGAWNPSSAVHAHAFGASVDYLRGHTDNGPQRWTRQIMLLKGKTAAGPNYFVFCDSADPLDGDPASLVPKWWNLRTVGGKSQVRVAADAIHYTSPFGPRLDVRFLQPDRIRAETREASRTHKAYAPVDQWRVDGLPVMPRDADVWQNTEETLSVTSVGPIEAQQDILVVLYPQGERESAPQAEPIADGAVKITTSEGTDWVFIDRHPFKMATDEVSFRGRAGAVRVRGKEVHLVLAEGPGEVGYRGTVLKSPVPATKVIPVSQLRQAQTIEVPAAKPTITFSLDPAQGEITRIVRGVQRQQLADGFAFAFDADDLICFFDRGVVFVGRRGGIVVDEAGRSVRLVMIDGEKLGCGRLLAWGCDGPYELTVRADRATGRSAGQGRFLNLIQPAGIDKMASLAIDGVTYVPGTSETVPPEVAAREPMPGVPPVLSRTLVVPLMPGEHEFELRNLPQPPIFREPEEW